MKEEIQGNIVIIVILAILGLIIGRMINYTNQQGKTFEYAQNGVIGASSECWLDNDIAKCIVDKKIISVDNFYIKED